MMRLDKFLAEMGRGSRAEVKKLIAAGRVLVNGKKADDPGQKVREGEDEVLLDDLPVAYAAYEYYMLNKPAGVISATRDESHGQTCVTELIRDSLRRDLFPVGRLDKDTEGLLLITNDGALAHRLLSPTKHVDKVYDVGLDGDLSEEAAGRLRSGVDIGDDKPTLPCELEILGPGHCRITIREGRYHQVKRMFQTEGLEVIRLERLAMGPLKLDESLHPGEYRRLTPEELGLLSV